MTPAESAPRTALVAAERVLYAAMIAKDFAALGEILAPDLVYVHSTGVAESRQAYLAGVEAGLYDYESIASRNPRIRIDGNVALIDGIVDMCVGKIGQPRDRLQLLFTLAWVRQGPRDAWRLYYRQATRIPDHC